MSEPAAADSTPTAVADAPETERRQKTDGKTKPKRQPPYAVLVHNDDDHTFPYVIEVLQRVCSHPLHKAEQLTEQIHRLGRAVVWTGAMEVAELKRDQIRGFGPDLFASIPVKYPLGVTIEPLPSE